MAVIKATIRKKRADGFCAVYLRVTHNRQVAYIKTDKIVSVINSEVVDCCWV